jgi:hypothetical protein
MVSVFSLVPVMNEPRRNVTGALFLTLARPFNRIGGYLWGLLSGGRSMFSLARVSGEIAPWRNSDARKFSITLPTAFRSSLVLRGLGVISEPFRLVWSIYALESILGGFECC